MKDTVDQVDKAIKGKSNNSSEEEEIDSNTTLKADKENHGAES